MTYLKIVFTGHMLENSTVTVWKSISWWWRMFLISILEIVEVGMLMLTSRHSFKALLSNSSIETTSVSLFFIRIRSSLVMGEKLRVHLACWMVLRSVGLRSVGLSCGGGRGGAAVPWVVGTGALGLIG